MKPSKYTRRWANYADVGGENAPDYVRGPYNEGGWWYERIGAHLVSLFDFMNALHPTDM